MDGQSPMVATERPTAKQQILCRGQRTGHKKTGELDALGVLDTYGHTGHRTCRSSYRSAPPPVRLSIRYHRILIISTFVLSYYSTSSRIWFRALVLSRARVRILAQETEWTSTIRYLSECFQKGNRVI